MAYFVVRGVEVEDNMLDGTFLASYITLTTTSLAVPSIPSGFFLNYSFIFHGIFPTFRISHFPGYIMLILKFLIILKYILDIYTDL